MLRYCYSLSMPRFRTGEAHRSQLPRSVASTVYLSRHALAQMLIATDSNYQIFRPSFLSLLNCYRSRRLALLTVLRIKVLSNIATRPATQT